MRATTYLSADPAAPLTAVAEQREEAARANIQRRFVLDLNAAEFLTLVEAMDPELTVRSMSALYALTDEDIQAIRQGFGPEEAPQFRNEASAAGIRSIGMLTGETYFGEEYDALPLAGTQFQYPDPEEDPEGFRAAIAAEYGVDPEQVSFTVLSAEEADLL